MPPERRSYSKSFKAQVIAECAQADTSIANVALTHNLVVLKKMLDLRKQKCGKVFALLDIAVHRAEFVMRNSDYFGIGACFVCHVHHANRTTANDNARRDRIGADHQYVQWIAIIA